MSYCRAPYPESDLYICGNGPPGGGWTCYGCSMGSPRIRSRRDLLRHMIAHLRKGDKVPAYATNRVISEIIQNRRNKG